MSIVPYPTLDEALSPGFEHRDIQAMKAASDEFDTRTGQNQYDRDSETYQRNVRRLDMLRDLMASTQLPHDRVLLADEIERLRAVVDAEARRLGL